MKETSSVQAAKNHFMDLYRSGTFTPGKKIPSETEMSALLNVSRTTWRKAVDLLQRDGLLVSRHGSGTYLQPQTSKIPYELSQLESMGHMIRESGIQETENDVTIRTGPASQEISDFLEVSNDTPLLCIRRIRYSDCGVISGSLCYLPEKYSESITPDHIPNSILSYLENDLSVTVTRAMTEIIIPNAEDPFVQELHLHENQSVFCLKQRHFSSKGLPVLYSLDYLRSDLFKFTIMRTRV